MFSSQKNEMRKGGYRKKRSLLCRTWRKRRRTHIFARVVVVGSHASISSCTFFFLFLDLKGPASVYIYTLIFPPFFALHLSLYKEKKKYLCSKSDLEDAFCRSLKALDIFCRQSTITKKYYIIKRALWEYCIRYTQLPFDWPSINTRILFCILAHKFISKKKKVFIQISSRRVILLSSELFISMQSYYANKELPKGLSQHYGLIIYIKKNFSSAFTKQIERKKRFRGQREKITIVPSDDDKWKENEWSR